MSATVMTSQYHGIARSVEDPGVSAFSFPEFSKPNLTLNIHAGHVRLFFASLAFDDDRCAMATAVTEPAVSQGAWIGT